MLNFLSEILRENWMALIVLLVIYRVDKNTKEAIEKALQKHKSEIKEEIFGIKNELVDPSLTL
jgi:hypothetical protein